MLSAVVMILGVGVLAPRFLEVMHRLQNLFRLIVEKQIEEFWSVDEMLLKKRRQKLFISRSEARAILADCTEEVQSLLNYCPHCGIIHLIITKRRKSACQQLYLL